jgi:endothelin-converting enzyme
MTQANFAEEAKAQADSMVEDLRAAFKELVSEPGTIVFSQVSETEWMDSATQSKAAEKADQMLQLIGYPDWLVDPALVDGYYATAPSTVGQGHFLNMIYTAHWSAIQDLITLRCPAGPVPDRRSPGRSQSVTSGSCIRPS